MVQYSRTEKDEAPDADVQMTCVVTLLRSFGNHNWFAVEIDESSSVSPAERDDRGESQ